MFKNILTLFFLSACLSEIGNVSANETKTRKCDEEAMVYNQDGFETTAYFGDFEYSVDYYRLILKCAKDITDKLVDPGHRYRDCFWIENLKYCAETHFSKKIDCDSRLIKLVKSMIEEYYKLQNHGYYVPECFRKYVQAM